MFHFVDILWWDLFGHDNLKNKCYLIKYLRCFDNSIIFRHVGERVRMDLQRKQSLPANKLATLMTKFDEVKSSGNMMPTATLAMGTIEGKYSLYFCFQQNVPSCMIDSEYVSCVNSSCFITSLMQCSHSYTNLDY